MNPLAIRVQYAVLYASCAGLVLFGVPRGAIALLIAVTVVHLVLGWDYRARARRRDAPVPTSRQRSDRSTMIIGAVAPVLCLAAGVLDLGRVEIAASWDAVRVPIVILAGLSVTSAAVVVSSLIDYYWVLPRLYGYVRAPLWESPTDPAWRSVTSNWLLHRVTVQGVVAVVPVLVLTVVLQFVGGGFWAWTGGTMAIAASIGAQSSGLPSAMLALLFSYWIPPLGSLLLIEDRRVLVWMVSTEGIVALDLDSPPRPEAPAQVTRVIGWYEARKLKRVEPDNEALEWIRITGAAAAERRSAREEIFLHATAGGRWEGTILSVPMPASSPSPRLPRLRGNDLVLRGAQGGAAAVLGLAGSSAVSGGNVVESLGLGSAVAVLAVLAWLSRPRRTVRPDSAGATTSPLGFAPGLQAIATIANADSQMIRSSLKGGSHDGRP